MEYNNKRLHRCFFTGHRPEKLSCSESEVKPLLGKAIDIAIQNGFTTFITGMAPGVDIWAAELVLEKRKNNPLLHLICAVPHPGFEKRRTLMRKKDIKIQLKMLITRRRYAIIIFKPVIKEEMNLWSIIQIL